LDLESVEDYLQKKPNQTLYHYTTTNGLIGILESKSIWATSHLHLNDAQEIEHAVHILDAELKGSSFTDTQRGMLRTMRQKVQEPRYIFSFSEHCDRLSQWRGYCPSGDGYALGFTPPTNPIFAAATQKRFQLTKCHYVEAKQRHSPSSLSQSSKSFHRPMATSKTCEVV
jgi:hypothetical protein